MKMFKAPAGMCCFPLLCAVLSLATPQDLVAQLAPVNLGSAGNYTILSETGITDVPPSVITGNVGASPITGAAVHLTCSEVIGTISVVDAAGPAPCSLIVPAALGQAILDMGTAYADAAGRTVPNFTELGAGNISGFTLVPGLYKWSTGVAINSNITLSGGPNAVWIFQIAGDLLVANNAQVMLAGGAQANNIFWQVGGPTAVTLGTASVFKGTILSAKQVIMNSGASMTGRALAMTQVTLQSTTGTSPGPLVGGIPVPVAPTVSSTVPTNLATGVSIGAALAATFSEAMNPATITPLTFTLMNGLTPVPGTVAYTGVTATFTPTSSLLPGTLYTAMITTGAQDPAGVALATNYVWTFTTGGSTPVLTPPTVTSTVPSNGAMNAAVGSALSATFSEPLNPLTVNTSTFLLKQGGTAVAGTVSYSGVTAVFTPASNLTPNVSYTATITTGVMDLSGNALAANYIWSFTTAPVPAVPPVVSSTTPLNNAQNVPVGGAMAATFNEPLNPLTVNTASFTLQQGATAVSGTVSYSGVTAVFTPLSSLAANTAFTATITTAVTDLGGDHLATNYVWSFTTGASASLTPPMVTSTAPSNGGMNTAVGSALAATFSEALNPLTVNTSTFTLKQGGTAVPGTVTYSGVTAVFTPASNLTPNTLYMATITTGVMDLSGNALAANYVWSFTTSATAPVPPVPPVVSFTTPFNNTQNVPVGGAISATFNEQLNPLTVTTTSFTLQHGAIAIPGTVSYSGVTAVFTPLTALAPNTVFTATIMGSVTDLAGDPMGSNYVWSFTTGATPNRTPPAVISTLPASGSANVSSGTALTAVFSEAINPLTVTNATFTLAQGGVSVSGAVTYSGVTATFTPASNLAANLTYTATITTAVTDLSGNALAANYVWSFSTAAPPLVTTPSVISTSPANGATFITTTTNVIATFSEAMNPATINAASFILQQGTVPVAGTITWSGTSATFRPSAGLAAGTVYMATITNAVADLSGNLLPANYQWSFTTGSSSGQTPVCLPDFAVLAGTSVINSGPSVISGDIGVSPGSSISGFPPGTLNGTTHAGDATAARAMADAVASYASAVARSVGSVSLSGDIGGQTLTAGLYTSATPLSVSSADLTLDAKGNPNAIFVFQAASTLTTATGRQIIMAGGAQAANVYWQVGTSATVGAESGFNGSILANQSIVLDAGAAVNGRLAAFTGSITLQSNVIISPAPVLAVGGTVNAASDARVVAAGSIASVFGSNLGSSTQASSGYPLPTTIGESSFQIGTTGAPLFLVSCSQANVQIPWEATGQTQVSVSETAGGLVSGLQPVTVAPYAPGIFSLNQSGTGQGAIEIAPGALLAAPLGPSSQPVQRGQYVAIFATGLGAVSNQPVTGAAASSSPLSFSATPVVTIGGAAAQVTYSGLAPGFAGLYQVNAIVPAGAPSGPSVTVVITIGGVASNTVTIAVQ